MARRLISSDQVKINGSTEIYGGHIYNANVNFGFSQEATTVSISVVSEDGNYAVDPNDLSTSSPHTLTIGGTITIDPVFLYEYQVQKQGNQRILQLVYKDASILLDKIFVGLNYIHGFSQGAAQTKYLEAQFSCQPCPGPSSAPRPVTVDVNGIYKDGLLVQGGVFRSVKNSDPQQSTISKWDGGYILLGDEQFAQNECDIPKVDYNLTSLLNLLAYNGITVYGLTDVNPDHRTDYVGTLREVLGNWCSDFGLSFYWNSFRTASSRTEDIIGIDLSNPVSLTTLDAVKTAIDSISRSDDYLVTSFNETYSLENTNKTYHVTSFKKDATVKQRNWTIYKQYSAQNITVQDLNPNKNMLLGRTYEQFITSCVLAKYSTQLRDIYNWKLLRKNLVLGTTSNAVDNKFFHKINSIDRYQKIDPEILGIENLPIALKLNYFFSHVASGNKIYDMSKDASKQFTGNLPYTPGKAGTQNPFYYDAGGNLKYRMDYSGKAGTEAYFIEYNQDTYDRVLSFEREVSDFIGRWYKVDNYWSDYKYCGYENSYSVEVDTNPSSKIYNNQFNTYSYSYSSDESYPFSKLMKENTNGNIFGSDAVRIFDRDTVYGSTEQSVEEVLDVNRDFFVNSSNVKTAHVLDNFTPNIEALSDQIQKYFTEKTYSPLVKQTFGKKNFKLLTVARQEILDDIVQVSSPYRTRNFKESYSSNASSPSDPDCTTICEYDLIEEICRCLTDQFGNALDYNGNVTPPYQGLNSIFSSGIDVTVKIPHSLQYLYYNSGSLFRRLSSDEIPERGETRTIILPCQDNYWMYYQLDISQKRTNPSVAIVEGQIQDAGRYARIEVSPFDVTQQIESYYNNQSNTLLENVLTPVGGNIVPRTTTDYHNARVQFLTDGIQEPQRTISASFVGFPSDLSSYIDPNKGLTSFNVNYDENGASYDIEFSNRPKQLPQMDAVSKKITPRLFNI
jgi:hypothetical protein